MIRVKTNNFMQPAKKFWANDKCLYYQAYFYQEIRLLVRFGGKISAWLYWSSPQAIKKVGLNPARDPNWAERPCSVWIQGYGQSRRRKQAKNHDCATCSLVNTDGIMHCQKLENISVTKSTINKKSYWISRSACNLSLASTSPTVHRISNRLLQYLGLVFTD